MSTSFAVSSGMSASAFSVGGEEMVVSDGEEVTSSTNVSAVDSDRAALAAILRCLISSAVNVLALFFGNSISGTATILLTYATTGADGSVSQFRIACSRAGGMVSFWAWFSRMRVV